MTFIVLGISVNLFAETFYISSEAIMAKWLIVRIQTKWEPVEINVSYKTTKLPYFNLHVL